MSIRVVQTQSHFRIEPEHRAERKIHANPQLSKVIHCVLLILINCAVIIGAAQKGMGSGPSTLFASASGPEWASSSFGNQQTTTFTAEMDATPADFRIDGGISLSDGPQTTFTGLACTARFNSSGFIDARNGGSYAAVQSIPYSANQTYHFSFVIYLANHTYDVYVTPPGQSEQTIGLGYAFRTEQQSLSVLNNWTLFADAGSMQASGFLSASATAIANAVWINSSLPPQNGSFVAEWDAIAMNSGMDGVMALSDGAQTSFTQFACLVRFYTDGTIQVRNGGNYAADNTISYASGVPYHFRVPVNLATHTYSVYVTPSGGTEQLLAQNYVFRSEQASVGTLNNLGIIVDTAGSLKLGNFAVSTSSYDSVVLADQPVAYWNVNPLLPSEPDLSGNGNTGNYYQYQSGGPLPGNSTMLAVSTMPDGESAAFFNGIDQYLRIPSNASGSLSIPTKRYLTVELWIRPDTLQFPNSTSDGYVDPMGKCDYSAPSFCEWEVRMYSTSNSENPPRPNRVSGYVFNPTGGHGAGAYWQPAPGVTQQGQWLHVVIEYTTDLNQTPQNCPDPSAYPGAINIWLNGIMWYQPAAAPTGCMSDPNPSYPIAVIPQANSSPLDIGTMSYDSWFQGAIGKVAIYDHLLLGDQISKHYSAMTGEQSTGGCTTTSPETCTF